MQLVASGPAPGRASAIVGQALRSSGRAMEPQTRAAMESGFGHDFARVRVHTGAQATASARAVRAVAYTVGDDIVFDSGAYAPNSSSGRRLLAHELTHVVQQRNAGTVAGQPAKGDGTLTMSRPGDHAEREAERIAAEVTAGRSGRVSERPAATMHGGWIGTGIGAAAGAGVGALIGSFFGPLGTLVGAGIGALAGGLLGYFLTRAPLFDMSTFQSPGPSGWRGAKFGCYRDGCTRPHRGWDIHATPGTNVYAVTSGTMVHNPFERDGCGTFLTLTSKSNPTHSYLYCHLSSREKPGDYTVGSKLGETGVSGNAQRDRPHLHFVVRRGGVPVDPSVEFREPSKVIEATRSSATSIDKTAPPPCAQCAM
jgi:murein DD-endopeptidase MepM/ murein hydrolase activator NlpD